MTNIRTSRSSFVYSIIHDAKTDTLTVTFKTGRRYRYYGVTKQKVSRFKSAPSFGSYYSTHIRGKYATRKLKTISLYN